MDASEASCSSRNVINDRPTVPFSERRGRESLHESNASASGGSNTPLATVWETHTSSPRNATAAIKLYPSLPRNGSMSVIQSSWIRRLKPFAQSTNLKEECAKISTKEAPICTHFTKDYSSCSRRLNKISHHTRSSSWPPHAMLIQDVEHFSLELEEPAGITDRYNKAMVISPNIDHQSNQARSNTIRSSIAGSRTGNLYAKQQSRCNHVSATKGFVSSALKRENSPLKKLNDTEESEYGGDCKPKDWLAQQIQISVKDVKKATSVTERKVALHTEEISHTEEAAKNWDISNGSDRASTGDGDAQPLSLSMYTAAHSSGASADADDRISHAKPLDWCMGIKTLPCITSFVKPDCEIACLIAGGSEDRINVKEAGEAWRSGRETTNIEADARSSGCVQTAKNVKEFKESVAKTYLLSNISDTGASNTFRRSPKLSYLAKDLHNAHERVIMTTCAAGSTMVAASGSLKPDVVPKRPHGFYSREIADLQGVHLPEGSQIHRSNQAIGSFYEEAARSRIREKSLGDYWNSWVRLLEGPDYEKAAQTGRPMAKLQQDYVLEECDTNLFQSVSCNRRSDAKQKIEECQLLKHSSYEFGNIGGCDLPQQQRPGSSSKNHYKFLDRGMGSSQIRMFGGRECYASADRSSDFNLKGLQNTQEHGAAMRADVQPHDKEADLHRRILDDGSSRIRKCSPNVKNERIGEESSSHQGWIRRWHSSAKFSATSQKTTAHIPYFSSSLSSDQLAKSNNASAQCPSTSNHKAMGSFDHTELGSGSSRFMEISGVRLDSGSGSTTPGSPLAGRNFPAFRSGYMAPCSEPMTTVKKASSKLPPKSSKNRGFCGLPCKVLPEDEKRQSVDSDDLEALENNSYD